MKLTKNRCHVKILDRYLQVLPHESKESDIFYLKSLAEVPPIHLCHGLQMYLLEKKHIRNNDKECVKRQG